MDFQAESAGLRVCQVFDKSTPVGNLNALRAIPQKM